MFDLAAGDILSYSAGSTQIGPDGFRKVVPRPGMLAAALERWPDLGAPLAERAPIYINAYPASTGIVRMAVTVDTYLSPRVLSRALQLAAVTDRPVILAGQSLFLADALLGHVAAGLALPRAVLLGVGGYETPRALEEMIVGLLAPQVPRLAILHGYGAAEVDAGCMVARERDASGRLVYFPRRDVTPELDGEALLLTLRDGDGRVGVERFQTGDCAARSGDGWVLWNHRRLHPVVAAAFATWTAEDWRRRTGYVRRVDDTVWIQLRQGQAPAHAHELDHWEFGRRYGFSWLDKPYWR